MRFDIKAIAMGFIGFVIRGVVLILLILAVYKAGAAAYDFGFRIFTEEPMSAEPGRDVSITISQGDSVMDVGEMLEEKGLIRDAKLFYVQKKCSVYDNDIQPGFYTLNTSMTAEEMFEIIAGKSGDEEEDEDDEDEETTTEAAPLTEADPLTEVTGEWEGSEEQEDDLENPEAEDQDDADEGLDLEVVTE